MNEECKESPEFLRLSLAAAMTLGFAPGTFYRDACLHCVNLLLTYSSGCAAKCAYCGLSGNRRPAVPEQGSFIRVSWPALSLDAIVEATAKREGHVRRICISMLTNSRAARDTESVCLRLRQELPDVPVSLLVSPTVLRRKDLLAFRKAGADKAGVAVDLATPELFERYRGSGVGGPHKWDVYWDCLAEALEIFGPGNAGAHLIVGMGETEQEMCAAIQRVSDMGGKTHLFSFFPEHGSALEDRRSPPVAQYRRIQMARYLIDRGMADASSFTFTPTGKITDFGIEPGILEQITQSGEPFRTSGCTGHNGEVACNRPYANSRPGPGIRNYPFPPDSADIARIQLQMSRTHP